MCTLGDLTPKYPPALAAAASVEGGCWLGGRGAANARAGGGGAANVRAGGGWAAAAADVGGAGSAGSGGSGRGLGCRRASANQPPRAASATKSSVFAKVFARRADQ